jgi:hypothetical protein
LKSPSFAHAWWAVTYAIWLLIITAMGSAVHGEAAKHEKKLII